MAGAVVTGAGAVSAAGSSPEALLSAMREGRSLASPLTGFDPEGSPCTRGSEAADFDLSDFVPSIKSYIDRTSALALGAGKLALEGAGLLSEDARAGVEIGLVYGTEWGCLDSMELFAEKLAKGNPRLAPPLPFSHSYANSPASILAIEFALRGHHLVFSTGRTSGAWALLGALDALEAGAADAVLAGGSDSLSRAAFNHYLAEGRLLPDEAENSRSEERFAPGEGAAFLLLERGSVRERRGKALARALGAAAATGATLEEAVRGAARGALGRARLRPGDVRSVVLTGPSRGAAAVERSTAIELFGGPVETLDLGAVLGETMGASGALGAVAAVLAAREGPAAVLSAQGVVNDAGSTAVVVLFGPA